MASTSSAISSHLRLDVLRAPIAMFCRRWGIDELALFGSVLRRDFRPDSDVDVLVTASPQRIYTLRDRLQMLEDLKAIFGRRVDLVLRSELERDVNWYRRREILRSAEVVHVA